jgi:hypothetical protein
MIRYSRLRLCQNPDGKARQGTGSRWEASAMPVVNCLQDFDNVACTGLHPVLGLGLSGQVGCCEI